MSSGELFPQVDELVLLRGHHIDVITQSLIHGIHGGGHHFPVRKKKHKKNKKNIKFNFKFYLTRIIHNLKVVDLICSPKI